MITSTTEIDIRVLGMPRYIHTVAGGNGIIVIPWQAVVKDSYKRNKDPKYTRKKKFPLKVTGPGRDASESSSDYPDVFWCLPEDGKSLYYPMTFLGSKEGKSSIGWIGFVLSNYLRAYNIAVDLEGDTNTFKQAGQVSESLQQNYAYIGKVLDAVQRVKETAEEKGWEL